MMRAAVRAVYDARLQVQFVVLLKLLPLRGALLEKGLKLLIGAIGRRGFS
jgi:hypothetical protein